MTVVVDPTTGRPVAPAPDSDGPAVNKSEDRRAAIIAKQAARQEAEGTVAPRQRPRGNWAASAPVAPRRGRLQMGSNRR